MEEEIKDKLMRDAINDIISLFGEDSVIFVLPVDAMWLIDG